MVAVTSTKEDSVSPTRIDRLYDASTNPDGWRTCFDILCDATGSMGAIFRSLDNPGGAIVTPSLMEAHEAYERSWWRHDLSLGIASRGRSEANAVLLDSDLGDGIDRTSHPFFQDYLRPLGLGSFAIYFSPPIFEAQFVLVAQRGRLAGPFSAEQTAAMVQLAPHVTRALAIAGQLTIARSRDEALLSILDKLTYGAMIIGRNAKVVTMNAAARALLDDGMTLTDGVLHETCTNPRGTVDRLIKLAFADEADASKNAVIHRESGRKPIVLQALTFPQASSPWKALHNGETILLMMIDTEISGAMSQLSAVQSFGLTLAEAKVAALVGSGISPTEAAEQLGSAAGTVRVQLKNVFNKLDIKRQSELVRLMAKLEVLGS